MLIWLTIKASIVLSYVWAFPHLESNHDANFCNDAMFVDEEVSSPNENSAPVPYELL